MPEYEKIDPLLMKSRRLANSKVRRLHISGLQTYRVVKLAQLLLCLYNIIINRKKEESNIKLKTLCKLANITGRHWWITLDVTSLINRK